MSFCAPPADRTEGIVSIQSGGSVCVLRTTRITQRDGRQGTDAPGSRTHVPGPGRQPEPGRWMSPGWRPSPRSPAVSGHPADSPAVPEPVLEPRRHQGIPAGAPAHPCAVTRSQLHLRSDGPRAARTTDEDASAATIQEDPVGMQMSKSMLFAGLMY